MYYSNKSAVDAIKVTSEQYDLMHELCECDKFI